MSLKPTFLSPVPEETARVGHPAFPQGSLYLRLRDELGCVFEEADFAPFFPSVGQPGVLRWRLALVTVFQFLEQLSDRQAADTVRGRIDWNYAHGLDLTDPGSHFGVLAEFRARLLSDDAETLLLDLMLERLKARGLLKVGGKQRTDSTHVLASVHDLHLLELVAETLRATLNDLSTVVPEWLRQLAPPLWFERYGRRIEDYRLPKSKEKREALALDVGADGFLLLDALDAPNAPAAARELPMIEILRFVWRVHFALEEGRPRWRSAAELPPVGERLQSPYDPEMLYSTKDRWSGPATKSTSPSPATQTQRI